MAARLKKKYTPEFKAQAVRLSNELGPTRAARQLGISEGNMSNWRKKTSVEKTMAAKDQATADREELLRLRKETEEQKK